MRRARRLVALLVLLAAVGPATGGVGAAASEAGPTTVARGTADVPTVVLTQSFGAIPRRPGVVSVTHRFEIPDAVETLETRVPEAASVTDVAGGFSALGAGRFEWDGGSQTPSVTYTLPVNETGSVAGPEGTAGRYRFVDVGEWSLFRRPVAPIDVTYIGSGIDFARRTETEGPGAAGDWLVFLGEREIHRRSAHGQAFRLVVPAAADPVESPDAILSSVTAASDALRVGDRDERVLMVAAPTGVDWAVRGLEVGESDLYVVADEPLDEPGNTWLHEYVHTRQDYDLSEGTAWLTEGTATYYAALLTLEQERIGFPAFRNALEDGTSERVAAAVLADPATWAAGANYRKGALVAGDLDRRLRLATDSQVDLQAVVRGLNERRRALDADGFVALVERAGSAATGDAARRFTTTSATPAAWDLEAHLSAFGQLPPRIRYELPDGHAGASYRVAGPYRNETLEEPPFVLVPGERLGVDLTVTNVGGTDGVYNASYGLDGEPLAYASGPIGVNETVRETVWVGVEAVGEPTVRVGGYALDVAVVEPATPEVTDLRTNRSTLQPGEAVAVTVDLENARTIPARRELSITANGETVATRTVRLAGRATETVTVPVRLDAAGEVKLAAGERSATVTVATPTAGAAGPGVGPVGAVLALVLAGLLARRHG